MSAKMKLDIENVSETLFLPVWARARESIKKIPTIFDPIALRIIEEVDYDFSSLDNNLAEISRLSWIARLQKFEELINNFLSYNPIATIVNLGCGLDSTYERINNSNVHWYDLDLPEVIKLRNRFVGENPRRKFISKNLQDLSWFNEIDAKGNLMIISIGTLSYLRENEVRTLLKNISEKFRGSEIAFDATSSSGLNAANSILKKLGFNDESLMKWALNDKKLVLTWSDKIKILGCYNTFQNSGLNLSLKNKILGKLSDALNIQYILSLKIDEK